MKKYQLDRGRRGRSAAGGAGWSDADRRRSGRKPSKAGGGADSGVGGSKTESRFRRWSAAVAGASGPVMWDLEEQERALGKTRPSRLSWAADEPPSDATSDPTPMAASAEVRAYYDADTDAAADAAAVHRGGTATALYHRRGGEIEREIGAAARDAHEARGRPLGEWSSVRCVRRCRRRTLHLLLLRLLRLCDLRKGSSSSLQLL